MYRLTFSEPLSRTWWSQKQSGGAPTLRTVYRWGTFWGYRDPKGYKSLSCVPCTNDSTKDVIVEQIEEDVVLPPVQIDDVWNEEVYIEGPAEYSGILQVCGFADALKAWCKDAQLPCPSLPTLSPLIQKAMALQKSHPQR
jgi:hypothetical protein